MTEKELFGIRIEYEGGNWRYLSTPEKEMVLAGLVYYADTLWEAARDETMALSDNVEDREAALHSLQQAKKAELLLEELGWQKPETTTGANKAALANGVSAKLPVLGDD